MTETVDWLEWAAPVADADERADLARWAVSLRRAQAAGTRQVTGTLTGTLTSRMEGIGHCCLGIWCQLKTADGTLTAKLDGVQVFYQPAGGEHHMPSAATLPETARLAGDADPDLLAWLDREEAGDASLAELAADHGYFIRDTSVPDVEEYFRYERRIATAAELNDDHGLSFGQIADVVVWRFGLTAEELALAEQAPRVPVVEGVEIPGSREPGQ